MTQDIEKKLSELEHKMNLILEQEQATQKAIAHLRGLTENDFY